MHLLRVLRGRADFGVSPPQPRATRRDEEDYPEARRRRRTLPVLRELHGILPDRRVELHAGIRTRRLRARGPLLPRGRAPDAERELGQGDRADQPHRRASDPRGGRLHRLPQVRARVSDPMHRHARRPERPEGQADRDPGIRLHEVHRLPTMRRRLPGRLPTHGGDRLQGSGRLLPHQPAGRSQVARGTGRKVARRRRTAIIRIGIVDLLYYSHYPSSSSRPGGLQLVRTTVVGNYPRIGDTFEEQSLRRAIARFDKGEINAPELADAERAVVKAALREQNEGGIDLVTDGQISWYDSQSHIARGFASVEINGLARYFDTNTYYRQPVVHGVIAWKEPILVDEWKFAQANSKAAVKAVLTGPLTLASLALDKHYRKKKPLAVDLANALGEEVSGLVRAGAVHIQIDEPILTRHPEDLPLAVEGLERIRARKGAAALTLFTYFGEVSKIFEELVETPVDAIGLDLVQGAATWSAIAKYGSEKPLVLGLVDARNTKKEDPAEVAKKVLGLKDRIDLKSSFLSPSNGLEFLPRERAREKLRILSAAAKKVGIAA